MAVSANRLELLQIADAVAREKSIDRGIVIAAMEDAIQKAARSRYGSETEVRAEINPKTGEMRLSRLMLVVEQVENDSTQIALEDAKKRNPAAQVGDYIAEALPPLEYGRIAAQSAKQVIVQKVREAERDRQYQEYKDRIGDIVNGIVKRVEYGNVVVDLGRGEAIVRRDEMLPRETFRNGDRIRAFIYDVRREPRGPQIFLSRTHPQFMAKLFAQEVPEIYDGIVEVKAVARDPGSRAKIAVISRDSSVDPVGACVGMRGSRVQAVVNELQGEKIDIIPWTADPANFVVNALAPAEVAKVVLDEDRQRMEVVVPDQQLSLAIGRRGQNVRLASQLTGWDIDIVTEQEESEHRQAEFEKRTKLFIEALNVDEVVGQLLASEGFNSVEELAMVDEKEIAGIEGFDEDTARELQARAREFLAKEEAELDAKRQELGVEDALKEVPGVTTAMLVKLGENGIKTVEDLAGCATDDLFGWSERKDGETTKLSRHPRRLRAVARGRRSADHAGARQGRLDQGGGSGRRRRPRRRRPRPRPVRHRREDARDGRRMLAQAQAAHDRRARRRAAPERARDGAVLRRHRRGEAGRDMIRFVVGPDGSVVPDLKRRLPGRGIWITATRQALARRDQTQGLCPRLQARRRARSRSRRDHRAAARARRARCARDRPQGREGRDRLRQGRGRAGARAGRGPDPCRRRRPRRVAKARCRRCAGGEDAAEIAVVEAFTSAQLDLALGRSNVIHAALLAGPESETFLARAARLTVSEPASGLPDRPGNRARPLRNDADEAPRELGSEWLKRRKRLAKRS